MNKEYASYLSSKSWKRKRDELKNKIGYKSCVVCYSPKLINTHHLTYRRIFNEKLTDLVFLCGRCHRKVHDIMLKFPAMTSLEAIIELKMVIQREILASGRIARLIQEQKLILQESQERGEGVKIIGKIKIIKSIQ